MKHTVKTAAKIFALFISTYKENQTVKSLQKADLCWKNAHGKKESDDSMLSFAILQDKVSISPTFYMQLLCK